MPTAMRKLAVMSLFQPYAMFAYRAYITHAIGRSVYRTADPLSPGFHAAVLTNGETAAWYNGVGFLAVFAMVPLARRIGAASLHAACLPLAGGGMLWLPHVADKGMLFLPAIGIGIGRASIMGSPTSSWPARSRRMDRGLHGIFDMMIVLPMLPMAVTLPLVYQGQLGGDPRNVLTLCGGLMVRGGGVPRAGVFLGAISIAGVTQSVGSSGVLSIRPACRLGARAVRTKG